MSGGFYIYRRDRNLSVSEIDKEFEARGFGVAREFLTGQVGVKVFPTLHSTEYAVYQEAGHTVIVCGTCILPGLDSSETLHALVRRFRADPTDRLEDRIGSHSLVHISDDGVRLLPDPMSLYPVYIHQTAGVISSSFLSLAMGLNTTPDAQAIRQLLSFGFILRPGTLAKEIRILQDPSCDSWNTDCCLVTKPLSPSDVAEDLPAMGLQTHARAQLDLLRSHLHAILPFAAQKGCDMGISGGFDSRLLLLLCREQGFDISVHTLSKSGFNLDQHTAEMVAKAAGMPLKILDPDMGHIEQEELVRSSIRFFDGRPTRMMSMLNRDYTAAYRSELLGAARMSLSGVGGEIYRNHQHTRTMGRDSLMHWVGYNLLDFNLLASIHDHDARKRFLQESTDQVAARLNLPDSHSMTLAVAKRIYAEIWLPDWHGSRNSIENQLDCYHAPFADRKIVAASYSSIKVLGVDGALEAEMIRQLDEKVARVPSSYGHSLDKIPLRRNIRSGFRCLLPCSIKLEAGLRVRAWKGVPQVQLNEFEQECLSLVKPFADPIDSEYLLACSSERKNLVLSIGAVLKYLWNTSEEVVN